MNTKKGTTWVVPFFMLNTLNKTLNRLDDVQKIVFRNFQHL